MGIYVFYLNDQHKIIIFYGLCQVSNAVLSVAERRFFNIYTCEVVSIVSDADKALTHLL